MATGGGAHGIMSWVDDALAEPGCPAIAPEDKGLVGDGVFEAIKVIDGTPFALRRHLERLERSAAPLGLTVDLDRVRKAIDGVLAASTGLPSPFWLRVTVTGGPSAMADPARRGHPTVIAAVAPMVPWGVTSTVVTVPWVRNERGALAGLKTLSYLENGLALRYANANGADEGIFANTKGDLCEGAGSNIFVVDRGRILTPPLTSGCLAGVTRELLLEWMPEIVESDIPMSMLAECDEAFLTSTSRTVHPIAIAGGRVLPSAPGPLTKQTVECFTQRTAVDFDP